MSEPCLKRKIDKYLLEWKSNSDHKPLIIKGCRQTGKNEYIRHFAQTAQYESVIEINFVKDEKGAGFRDYRGCEEWLIDAGIVTA